MNFHQHYWKVRDGGWLVGLKHNSAQEENMPITERCKRKHIRDDMALDGLTGNAAGEKPGTNTVPGSYKQHETEGKENYSRKITDFQSLIFHTAI